MQKRINQCIGYKKINISQIYKEITASKTAKITLKITTFQK